MILKDKFSNNHKLRNHTLEETLYVMYLQEERFATSHMLELANFKAS
jgi:hypothetical protein